MNNIFLLLREYNNNLCMKNFKFLLLSACIALVACTTKTSSEQQVSDKGTKWSWDKGTIVVETPERPAEQTNKCNRADDT